ncbi:hypothetical protein F5B20DRAFT_591916 [Whalleya microplaca]|nr:hypothetical protein F5B20DRAFT_591916 [Whalleya microplaca]
MPLRMSERAFELIVARLRELLSEEASPNSPPPVIPRPAYQPLERASKRRRSSTERPEQAESRLKKQKLDIPRTALFPEFAFKPAGPEAGKDKAEIAKSCAADPKTGGPPELREVPPLLATAGVTKTQWIDLENSQKALPRFLFRFWNSHSGGGFDPRLNNKNGVVPHGFLQGEEPTNMFDIPDLKVMINGHLTGRKYIRSQFSSWAADIEYVIQIASSPTAHIAILDLNRLQDHVQIYHVNALFRAGIANHPYPHEYLAYGPIAGPAYHCVRFQDMVDRGLRRNFSSYTLHWDVHLKETSTPSEVAITAKKIATIFQPPHEKRPDIIIAVTAAMIGLLYRGSISGRTSEASSSILQWAIYHLRKELRTLQLPGPGSGTLGLFNPKTYTTHFPCLDGMVCLLQGIEDAVREKRKISRLK